jgi:hypothetical protein
MGIVQAYIPELPRSFRFMIWFIKILFILGMLGTYLSVIFFFYNKIYIYSLKLKSSFFIKFIKKANGDGIFYFPFNIYCNFLQSYYFWS